MKPTALATWATGRLVERSSVAARPSRSSRRASIGVRPVRRLNSWAKCDGDIAVAVASDATLCRAAGSAEMARRAGAIGLAGVVASPFGLAVRSQEHLLEGVEDEVGGGGRGHVDRLVGGLGARGDVEQGPVEGGGDPRRRRPVGDPHAVELGADSPPSDDGPPGRPGLEVGPPERPRPAGGAVPLGHAGAEQDEVAGGGADRGRTVGQPAVPADRPGEQPTRRSARSAHAVRRAHAVVAEHGEVATAGGRGRRARDRRIVQVIDRDVHVVTGRRAVSSRP